MKSFDYKWLVSQNDLPVEKRERRAAIVYLKNSEEPLLISGNNAKTDDTLFSFCLNQHKFISIDKKEILDFIPIKAKNGMIEFNGKLY